MADYDGTGSNNAGRHGGSFSARPVDDRASTPPVLVAVTVWNQAERTVKCLDDVARLRYPSFRVVVIDNGSTDDTIARVEASHPEVSVLSTGKNLGTPGGYNTALRHGLDHGYDLIFLINNDILIHRDCLAELVREALQSTEVGLVMPKTYYAADPNRIWSVGNSLNAYTLDKSAGGDGELDTGQWETAHDIDYAPFCAVLLTRALLEKVGFLDERIFLYYDDMDFCRRARLAGFRLRVAPNAKLWHEVGLSSGGPANPAVWYWMGQGSGYYFRKHSGPARLLFVVPYRVFSALRSGIPLILRLRLRAALALWLGVAVGWTRCRADVPPPAWLLSRT
jgi:GT2 family glycosyltransferase